MIISPAALAYFDGRKAVVVQADASMLGAGTVLLQDGQPVAYASKSFTDWESNYIPTNWKRDAGGSFRSGTFSSLCLWMPGDSRIRPQTFGEHCEKEYQSGPSSLTEDVTQHSEIWLWNQIHTWKEHSNGWHPLACSHTWWRNWRYGHNSPWGCLSFTF